MFALSSLLSLNAYDIDINGFLNATAGKSDNKETLIAKYGNPNPSVPNNNADSVKFKPDSLMGLQLSSSISNHFSATLQLVGRFQDDKAKLEMEWAYITYSIEHLQIQVGRYRPAVYMYSNTYDVAHSYLWTRLPIEVYDTVPITDLDGINFIFDYEFDNEIVLSAKAYYGNRDESTTFNGIKFQATFDNTYGAELAVENEYVKMRFAYAHSTISATFSNPIINLGLLGTLNLNTYPGLKLDNNKASFYSVGLNAGYSNIILASEIIHTNLEPSFAEEQTDSYYVLVGYNINNFTPSITYSSKRVKYKNNTDAVANLVKGNEPDQRSITAGVRYDINPSTALKVEWMRTDQKHLKNSINPQYKVSNSATNLYTLSLNFVF